MKYFWFFIYNVFFLPSFWIYVHAASIFNPKIKRGLVKRRTWFAHLKNDTRHLDAGKKNILIQCSSLGEFHEAKPVIEELDRGGDYNFIISFFSTSGYDNFEQSSESLGLRNSRIVKTLLPFDSLSNIEKFLSLAKPSVTIFIKYDLWFNLLWKLSKRGIRGVIINAKYRRNDVKWKIFLRSFFVTMYNFLNVVVTANRYSERVFKRVLSGTVDVKDYGDTKLDYIMEAADRRNGDYVLKASLLQDKVVFVAGSTWKEDEGLLVPVLEKISSISSRFLSVIAPHEPNTENIVWLEERISEFPGLCSIRYSGLNHYGGQNIIIIDNIGLLFSLYRHADIAYVGGGFGNGLHNVLEPASCNIPVLFGNERLSEDARLLLHRGSGISIGNADELYNALFELVNKKKKRNEMGRRSGAIFENRPHASRKIAELISNVTRNSRVSGNLVGL
jgi:3-deoxy-D-manno-octulosonic-acid transferase